MPQWMPEDRTRFDDLCRRAEQQSREAARRAAPAAPPPPPAPQAPAGDAPPAPQAPAGDAPPPAAPPEGTPPQRAAVPPQPPVPARRPALDQETLLILVVLAFLLRCRADRELIWALLYILLF